MFDSLRRPDAATPFVSPSPRGVAPPSLARSAATEPARPEVSATAPTANVAPAPSAETAAPVAPAPAAAGTPLLHPDDLTDDDATLGAIARAEEVAKNGDPKDPSFSALARQSLVLLDRAEVWLINQRTRDPAAPDDSALAAQSARLRAAREALIRANDTKIESALTARLTPASGSSPDGRLYVAGACAEDDVSTDLMSFTNQLNSSLAAHPEAPLLDAITQLAADTILGSQFPTIVDTGAPIAPVAGDAQKHRQVAVLVANLNYQSLRPLRESVDDATGLQAALAGRGYEGTIHQDQTAADMTSTFESSAQDPSLGPGDSLFLYYNGHSGQEGMCGVEYSGAPPAGIYGYRALDSTAAAATSRGVNTTVLVDACHAGQAVSTMRRAELGKLTNETKGGDLAGFTDLARRIDGAKRRFGIRSLQLRSEALVKLNAFPNDKDFVARAYHLLQKDLHAELAGLAEEFAKMAGKPLATAKRLTDLDAPADAPSLDVIDDLTNEVIGFVQAQRAQEAAAPGKTPA